MKSIYLRPTGETHTQKIWRHRDAVKEPARQDLSAANVARHEFLSILCEPFLWTILEWHLELYDRYVRSVLEKSGMSQAKAMVAPGKNEATM